MTAKEKLAMEHPEYVDEAYVGGCKDCPTHYGYLNEPEYCKRTACDQTCRKCWDREIPEDIEQDTEKGPRILDSGDRTEFESGAVRDMRKGKGRCDLLPLDVVSVFMWDNVIFRELEMFQASSDVNCLYRCLDIFSKHWDDSREMAEMDESIKRCWCTMLLEVAKHFEEGAVKYGDDNWRKGIPVRCYIDSAIRHYLKFIRGDKDEPHDRAFCWNILCGIWTCKHKPELNEYAAVTKDDILEKTDGT